MKKFSEDKSEDFKFKSLTSSGRIIHWICMYFMLPRVGTFQKINNHDPLVICCLLKKVPFSSPHLIINYMIKATQPMKSTFSVLYGMLMTLVFKHFGVPLEDKANNDDVLSQGEKNVAISKLIPHPGLKKACRCFDEEEEQNKEKKRNKKNEKEEKERKDTKRSPQLLTNFIKSG